MLDKGVNMRGIIIKLAVLLFGVAAIVAKDISLLKKLATAEVIII